MEEKQQQQQQTVLLQPQVQPSYGYVYTDLPLVKLKRLAIAQIVLGSFCIGFYIVTFVLDQHWFSSLWDFIFGCLILACGVTAMQILTRKNRTMVQATAIMSIIAAVLAAITVLLCIIALVALFVLESLFKAAQEHHDQYRNTDSTDTVTDTNTDRPLDQSDGVIPFRYVTVGMELVFFFVELVIASMLAHVTRHIMRNSQLVPVNPIVTTVVYAQA